MRLVAILLLASLPASAVDISRLSWLSGCWTYNNKETGSGEYWMPPAGGTMFAVSRIVKDSQTVAFEYLKIVTTDSGSLALIATPSGQDAARFDLLNLSDDEVVFENPEHDFPQRILYRLTGNQLLGRIEGKSSGHDITVDFPMTRTDCEEFGQ